MKKIVLLTAICIGLAACGGPQKALRPGSTPDKENAVFVAKVELSPAINEDFKEAKAKDKRMINFALGTTQGDGTNIKEWDDKIDTDYNELETNKFFAIEVKAGKPIAVRGLAFNTDHKAYWLSSTEHFYYTNLTNPSYAIDMVPEAGKAYYIGTIKIALAEKSFKETGDEEYDRSELQFVVPKSIVIVDESADAKKWFKENHGKIDGELKTTKVQMKDSGQENKFNHTAVTTYRR